MKIDISNFENIFFDKQNKFIDNLQGGIKIIPITTGMTAIFNKKCGLLGLTGAFFRFLSNEIDDGINDFDKFTEVVRKSLSQDQSMSQDQIDEFIIIFKDIFYINGNLNIPDSSFLKYLPIVPNDENIPQKQYNAFKDGTKKIAEYVASMLTNNNDLQDNHPNLNIFSKIIHTALSSSTINKTSSSDEKTYYILPYIKESFQSDFKWMIKQEESVKIKYFPLFLYFYICYSITQSIVNISPKRNENIDAPVPFYFILKSEKASTNHDAVIRGWDNKIPTQTLNKIFGKVQALNIANALLENTDNPGPVGFYPEILTKLQETPFEENKEACEQILKEYIIKKIETFKKRISEKSINNENRTISVSSYQDFLNQLDSICTELISTSYTSRIRKKITDILQVRLLQNRRGKYVLILDYEMLIFLIALFTQGKKVKLDDLYKKFNQYGIHFNRGTRTAIEEYLLKLNLLDRKSDSGEAQYVRVIL